MVAELVQQCVSENAHTALDQTEYQKRYDGLVERFDRTKERLEAVNHAIIEKQAQREQIERFLAELDFYFSNRKGRKRHPRRIGTVCELERIVSSHNRFGVCLL